MHSGRLTFSICRLVNVANKNNLTLGSIKMHSKPTNRLRKLIRRRHATITEVVTESTAGGVVFRHNPQNKAVEFLLIQDSKGRWTLPKGHIEPDEMPELTAAREIYEETGLSANFTIIENLGKISFRYRREQSLVLMTMATFLILAEGNNTDYTYPEEWIRSVKWFPSATAIDKVEYEDIAKLMLVAQAKIRQQHL